MRQLTKFITLFFLMACSAISFAEPAKPRIISLTPSLTDMVIELGGEELLVGVSDYDKQLHNLQSVDTVGNLNSFSMEKIISLQPDLILVWPSSIKPSQQQQLESLGYKIVKSNPTTLDNLAIQFTTLGKIIGKEEQGKTLTKQAQAQLAELRQRYQRTPPLTVFYQVWDKPMYTIGKDQIIGDALKVCGAENIFADLTLPAPQVSVESVLARNPQVIIVNKQALLAPWQAWPQLAAVKNNKLITFDNPNIARPSFGMFAATKILCQTLNE